LRTCARVKNWVYKEAGRFDIWVVDVILVSAMMGYGVQTLETTLRELSNKRKQDVYILGSANVGKSTLVNRLIQAQSLKSTQHILVLAY
jgi:30S ribosome assembly GTPase